MPLAVPTEQSQGSHILQESWNKSPFLTSALLSYWPRKATLGQVTQLCIFRPGFPALRALTETDLSQVQEEAGVLAGLGKVGEKDGDADEQHCGVLTHLPQGLQGKGWATRKNVLKFDLISLKNLQVQRQPNQGLNTLKIRTKTI